MKVALAQIDIATEDPQANLAVHLDRIQAAVGAEADLIVFPELSLTGDKTAPREADVGLALDSEVLVQICEASREIDILVGLDERGEINLYNRYNSAFYFSKGKLIHRHRKLFLVTYAVFEEGKHFVPGNNLQAFNTRQGRMCTLICNDPWHAAAPYLAALDGAQILMVPANSARGTLKEYLDIPATWEYMNRAYSATMGFYTIFVNRVGARKDAHGEYPYWGGSEIIDPRGEVVVKAPYDEEALVYGEIELGRVVEQRYSAPILRDARLWILRQEVDRLASKRSEAVSLDSEAVALEPDGSKPKKPPGERARA